MSDLSIGDLARATGVKIPTIRYYEQMGLIPAPPRTEGNQRRYGRPELDRLTFIKHARDLGLPMEAIRDLIDLSAHPEQPCGDAERIATEQLTTVRAKIAKLKRLEAELVRITSHDHGAHRVADCHVLRALGDHSLCGDDH